MPIAIMMRRSGEVLLPLNRDGAKALLTLPENRPLRANVNLPRSKVQHGRFFAAIDEAMHHWPELHEFQPEGEGHLRAWLLCRVGHVQKPFDEIPVPDGTDPGVVAAIVVRLIGRVKDEGKWAFPRVGTGRIRIYVPATINWDDVDQKAFAPVAQAVFEEIENILGVTVDQLLEERSQRARTKDQEELEAAS